jgi:RND family efflux transporter MFP subunit
MMTKISKYLKVIISISIPFFTACSSNINQKQEDNIPVEPTVEVTSPIKDQPLYAISLPGELKPYEQVNIYAKVKGFIKEIYVDRGSFVKKGQLLALLEAPEITQQYLSAKSNESKFNQEYLYAEQAYERLKEAAKTSGAVAGIELDKALSNLNSAKAALDASKAQSGIPQQFNSYLRITAPFEGLITQRNISAGALVGDGTDPLFNLAQNQKLRLTIAIPEKHAQSIHQDMDIDFTINGLPGQSFTAALSRASNLIQSDGRSLITEFDVDNSKGILSGGEYAQVRLHLKRPENTIWVPSTSLVRAQSGTFIWKVDENHQLQKIPVIEGSKLDALQEVYGLINEKDLVVKNGSEEMVEGTQVKITNKS